MLRHILGCGILLASLQIVRGEEPVGKDVFGPTKLLSIHLEIMAKEYEAMQPPADGGFGVVPAPRRPTAQPAEKRDSERNLFGTEFRWAHADFSAGGTTLKNVGIRYAGEITYLVSAQGLKRPLHIDFAKFGWQKFHGLRSLQLHAMPMDPSKAREAVTLSLFRAAGVIAPRTAFAEVTLTVPGKYDKEPLGLYAVVETVDKTFLADRFGADNGALMKPFQVRSVEYLGEDWERYKGQYRPQTATSAEDAKRVVAFAKLVLQSAEAGFEKEIQSYLDVDQFLRFLAANALTTNLESVFALGHNYYLYLNPQTNKFVFIPADLEFALANFLLFGTPDQLMDLSLTHPYPGDNKLVQRLLAIKSVNARYQQLLKELAATVFTRDRIVAEVDAIEKLTKEPLAREKVAAEKRREGPGGFGLPWRKRSSCASRGRRVRISTRTVGCTWRVGAAGRRAITSAQTSASLPALPRAGCSPSRSRT